MSHSAADATSAKTDARRTYRAIRAGSLPGRLLTLYRQAAAGQLADKDGRRWPGLTDYEAAAYLGCERSSVNAARAGLVKRGHVGKVRRRRCRYRPSNQDVWAWGLVAVPSVDDR